VSKKTRQALSYFNRWAPGAVITEERLMACIRDCAEICAEQPEALWELDECVRACEALYPGIVKRMVG
jgi:hypothetical protein